MSQARKPFSTKLEMLIKPMKNKENHEIQKACDTNGFPCNKGELKIHFSKDATIKTRFTPNFRATKTSLFADVLLA